MMGTYNLDVKSADSPPSLRPSWILRLPFHYGWVILPMGMLGVFASGPGQTFTISIFVDHIIGDLGLSRTLVSGLYTAGSLIAAFLLVFVGLLLDRLGARVMLFIVGALFGLAALWMSTVDNSAELLTGFAALRLFGAGSLPSRSIGASSTNLELRSMENVWISK